MNSSCIPKYRKQKLTGFVENYETPKTNHSECSLCGYSY